LKFFTDKRGLAITYAIFSAFFLFFSIPIGAVFLTFRNGETFSKLNEIIGNQPANLNHAETQFRLAFYFVILMVVLTGFMYLLTAKSRSSAFRFLTIIFGSYTIISFGYKVIVGTALTTAISKLESGPLKVSAPAIAKSFTNNFLVFGLTGALLSILSLLLGLLGNERREA